MKPVNGYNKLRGGYYTPDKIAEFIVEWAIHGIHDTVLEPSCGDGSFLNAVTSKLNKMGCPAQQLKQNVVGIELDDNEAKKAANYGTKVICSDFFTYYRDNIDGVVQYDAIVGNPPFIRYQNFSEDYRKVAFSLMSQHGFHPNRLTNIWLPFLDLSCKALKPDGRIGMVIPAELFQVNYASETRLFLSTYFESLTLVTFKRLVFDDIQQEVILLLGERRSANKGIKVVELNDLQELTPKKLTCLRDAELKHLDHSREKWVKYYLTSEELSLLDRLNSDRRISDAQDLLEVNVGLVSGENAFFLLNNDGKQKNKLEGSVVPIISRSEQLKGIELSDDDYRALVGKGKKVFFFAPGNRPFEELSTQQQNYIMWGESQGYNENYKCRIRPRWYHVSQTWCADAFLIRQANLYPRMILNRKKALVTDTLHKVRFRDGIIGEQVVAAFLNTYTFALSETLGRSYGGGVLTFEPGEMRKIRIPMTNAEKLDMHLIDLWQRNGEVDKILDYTDKVLLQEGLGLSDHDVVLLRGIWVKMRNRRLARKG